MNDSNSDRIHPSLIIYYAKSSLRGAIFMAIINGILTFHNQLRGLVIGSLTGVIIFPILTFFQNLGDVHRWRRSIRESFNLLIFFTAILISNSLRDQSVIIEWLPFELLMTIFFSLGFFIALEISWEHRGIQLIAISALGTAIGIWLFYHVTADIPLLMTQSMMRHDMPPTESFLFSLASSIYSTMLAFDLGGLWLVLKDWKREKAR